MAAFSRWPAALAGRRSALANIAPSFVAATLIVAVALMATERLEDRSPVVAVALALLVVLPAWMVFSSHYAATLAALMLFLGLVDGVFKLELNTQAATLGRDVLLYSIVGGALARLIVSGRPLRLPPLGGYVLAFVVVALVQIANPGTGGIVHGLEAIRPHIEFVPLFFFGYMVMRTTSRLRLFLLLLCVVAAINGIVGLIQFQLSPAQLASWGPGYAERINGNALITGRVFYSASGASFVRPFALGPDLGFGGAVGLLAVPALMALVGTAHRRWSGRIGAPLAIGIVLALATSQTRAAVIAAVVGLLAFAGLALASRRRAIALIGVAGLITLTVALVSAIGGGENGAALARYNSIAPGRVLVTAVTERGGSLGLIPAYIEKYPLGAGLGRVGPASGLGGSPLERHEQALNGESEFTFLVIELGVMGLLILGALTVRLLVLSIRLRRLRNSELRLLLAGCAAPMFAIAAGWLTGPVSSATPAAPYFWFTAGTLAYWLMTDRHTAGSPHAPNT